MYIVMQNFYDNGREHCARLNMRTYTLAGAKRIADRTPGAYVCPFGKLEPVYVPGVS